MALSNAFGTLPPEAHFPIIGTRSAFLAYHAKGIEDSEMATLAPLSESAES